MNTRATWPGHCCGIWCVHFIHLIGGRGNQHNRNGRADSKKNTLNFLINMNVSLNDSNRRPMCHRHIIFVSLAPISRICARIYWKMLENDIYITWKTNYGVALVCAHRTILLLFARLDLFDGKINEKPHERHCCIATAIAVAAAWNWIFVGRCRRRCWFASCARSDAWLLGVVQRMPWQPWANYSAETSKSKWV